MKSNNRQRMTAAGGLAFLLGLVLLSGLGQPLSALPGPAFADGQVALVLNGNQCNSTSGSMPSACATGCYIYSCDSLSSASPGVIMGTTDAEGNVQLVLDSYSDGSGVGYFVCPGSSSPSLVSWQFSPFFELAAYESGQWQLQPQQWYPGTTTYGCPGTPQMSSSSPYQFTSAVKDAVTGLTTYVDLTVCPASCSSPQTITSTATTYSTTTYTTTATFTSIVQGTATTETTTATITQPLTQTVTQTLSGTTTTSTVTRTLTTDSTTIFTTFVPHKVGTKGLVSFSGSQAAGLVLVLVSLPILAEGRKKRGGD